MKEKMNNEKKNRDTKMWMEKSNIRRRRRRVTQNITLTLTHVMQD